MKPSSEILCVIPTLRRGGAERLVVDLVSHLSRFYSFTVAIGEDGPLRDELPAQCRVEVLGRRSVFSFPGEVLRLSRLLAKTQPRLAIGFMVPGNLLLLTAHILSRQTVPIVLTEHIAASIMVRHEDQFLGPLKVAVARALYKRATHTIAVSEGVKREVTQTFRVPAQDVSVIYNGCDSERITRMALETDGCDCVRGGGRILVTSGRMTPQKDFSTLLKAFSIVRNKLAARLLILGDGPLRRTLQSEADALSLSDDVIWLGMQANPYKFIAKSDLFVSASRYEGLPLALIESLCLGTPLVATRCHWGPDEIVSDSGCGLLVEVGDVQGLAAACIRMLTDEAFRLKCAERAEARARLFSLESCATAYQHRIDKILS